MPEASPPAAGPQVWNPAGSAIEDGPIVGERILLSARGELDLHLAPELQDRIDAALARGARLIALDLSAVTFVDSMVLGVLLGGLHRSQLRGADLRLVVPNPELRRIFEISLLDQVFTIDTTREEAFAPSLEPGGSA